MREIKFVENQLLPEMEELIEYHLPGRSRDTLSCYKMWDHETLLYYTPEGKLDAMLSYFFLDFPFDMIIVMQRDNKFYKHMWRTLRDTTQQRVKPLRIMSDPNNRVLVNKVKEYGGEWHKDEIWFT